MSMSEFDPPFPCTNARRWTYDLFLSCSGGETKNTSKNFTDHLYSALVDAGINTFRSGEEIAAEQLMSAIHESRICLIVFSKNYTDSGTVLDELAEIYKSSRVSPPQLIFPVFYDVDPAEVRKQSESFSGTFERHEEQFGADLERVANWKAAVAEMVALPGWDFTHFVNRHECKFVKKIVNHVLKELSITYLNVATHPVGIEARLQKLNSLLAIGTNNETLILGICGKFGTGKTTLIKAIYNQYFHCFEGKSFIGNIRSSCCNNGGLIHLQEQLLMDIFKKDEVKISSLEEGCDLIKRSLQDKRVLIILDDVDQIEQVMALSARRDWFGSGSRIIMTTRNVKLFDDVVRVEEVYLMENFLLDKNEALELFCWNAFQYPYPPGEFVECSEDIISSFERSPLTLEVLGTFLFGRDILEWKSAIEKWKSMPYEEMLQNLMNS